MSSAQRKCSEMLLNISAALERSGIRWCIPSGYGDYPESVEPNDVDIIVEPTRFFEVAQIMAHLPDLNVVQYRLHEATAIRYDVVSHTDERSPVLLGIDVWCDIRNLGAVFMSAEEFLAKRRRFREVFWIPDPSVEFAYYLLRRLAKSTYLGPFDARHDVHLTQLYREDPQECLRQLARFFPHVEARLVANAAESGHWEPIRRQSARLFKTMLRKVGREQPLSVLRYAVSDLWRRIRRIAHPTGLMVAFLGPDGAGKSTVMERVQQGLFPQTFRFAKSCHLRPHLAGAGPKPEGLGNPHAQPSRGTISSLAKLGLWWMDYTLGYWVAVFPPLLRSALVLFDRYYHDLLVDQRRYRYSGSLRLARLVGWLVPQPHLVILLDAPPQVLQARKRDVTYAETIRQRDAYLKLVHRMSNGYVVDASRPLDEVVTETEWVILDYMAERTARRLGIERNRWTGSHSSLQEHLL
jgi:thymidylate kinase